MVPHLLPGVCLVKIKKKLHDLKRNGRRDHYGVTKTLESDDNKLILNASHSFTAREPR